MTTSDSALHLDHHTGDVSVPSSVRPSTQSTATTKLGHPAQPVDPRVRQGILKAFLVVFGLLSLAQFAAACAFFINPLEFNILRQNKDKSKLLTSLPAIANVTNKTADFWLATAVAVVGLWVWEKHLSRNGTSLDELEAWGCLLANDIPFSLMFITKLGYRPVLILVLLFVVVTAATSAFTNALTPAVGQVTINEVFNLPSLFVSDLGQMGLFCARDSGSECVQNDVRG